MIRFLVAAPASGSGKTVLTCALLRAFRNRGLDPCAFKCGPDYLDPLFHRAVLGVESHNLDAFLCGEDRLHSLFAQSCQGHGAAVAEGVMGLYDGLGGVTHRASTWEVAQLLDLPVLLVLPARGGSLTLAAQLKGLRDFRPDSRIRGVILNQCSPSLCKALSPVIEQETAIPVLGCFPTQKAARIGSRHLGLLSPEEVGDLDRRLGELAQCLEENVDLDRLCALFQGEVPAVQWEGRAEKRCRIGVARDRAFSFCYAETLETLARFGGEPVFFSPLRDKALPAGIGGLYLPGGYPELYAQALSENGEMRRAVGQAIRAGMPTVAECGGFLYLCEALHSPQGAPWPMVGVLPGEGADQGKLVHFGYATLMAEEDSLLFRRGESVPVHSFHHWDSTQPGNGFSLTKPVSGKTWREGYAGKNLYAAFPHLYFAGNPHLAQRFVEAAVRFGGTT